MFRYSTIVTSRNKDVSVLGTAGNLKKNTLENIKIGDTTIHQTSKIKFLGVHLDPRLSLKDHVQNRSKKPTTILS